MSYGSVCCVLVHKDHKNCLITLSTLVQVYEMCIEYIMLDEQIMNGYLGLVSYSRSCIVVLIISAQLIRTSLGQR